MHLKHSGDQLELAPTELFFVVAIFVQNNLDWPVLIDGQAHLVRLVHLQMDNFRLFLRQQTDKRQTSVSTMSKR